MKKLNITLFTAIAAAAAFAPTAQATITATGNFDLIRTQPYATFDDPNPGDWKLTYFDGSLGAGTLNVAGGSLFDANGKPVSVGWGAGTSTITVTGPGSELRNSGRFVVGNNTSHGDLIVEAGGLVDVQGQLHIGATGLGTALVTGVNSKLTTPGTLYFGQQASGTGILTVEDSGLVQASGIQFGWDSNPNFNSIHMGVGGVLAVLGDKTLGTPFVAGAGNLFTIQGTGSFGEIQYLNGATWENMTGASAALYDLTYYASGGPTVNGQDLTGYTVLTMLGGTTPAADPEITSITSLGGGDFELTLKGEPSTSYQFYSSATLDFDTGTLVLLTVSGNPNQTDVTTDGSGDATVEMSPGGSVNFVRAAVGP